MTLADEDRPAWHREAACVGKVDLFFPRPGDFVSAARAKQLCDSCPVFDECDEAGRSEQFGIWAGLSARDRRPSRRRAAQLRSECRWCGDRITVAGWYYCSPSCREAGQAKARQMIGLVPVRVPYP
jgi:hypothetical protein